MGTFRHRGLPLGGLLVSVAACGVVACGQGPKSAFLLDCIDDPSCADASGNATPITGAPTPTLKCFDDAKLQSLADMSGAAALSGEPRAFDSDRFNYMDTVPITTPADITVLANSGTGLACGQWDGKVPFTLLGGKKGQGPVLIEPVHEGDFMPTVLQKAPRTGNAPYLPVFMVDQIDKVFTDIGVTRDPDKGQIVIVAISSTLPDGSYFIQDSVEVSSSFAEGVAYKKGNSWSTTPTATTTTGDGLALLYNVAAKATIDGSYAVTTKYQAEEHFNVTSVKGAVTYVLKLVSSAASGP
ncbi:MAG TPA: hypothetical protein VL137_02655 [Polyangiaceae bacterium]|nr:hypothetical protein [Polyangiaceae bacterium]